MMELAMRICVAFFIDIVQMVRDNKFNIGIRHKGNLYLMARNLPPLSAIRVFDAAARHGSFTTASTELGMTQAAVSYQIKILEERVGTALFERIARGVQLTKVGRRLFQQSSAALDILSDAYSDAQGANAGTLSISVIPTFATSFLAQRIGTFHMEHSDIAVRMEVGETLVDFATNDIDAAIRSGYGTWEGLNSHLLIPAVFTPMLSPMLIEEVGGLSSPEDLLKLPLLSEGDAWWRHWLSLVGLCDACQTSSPKKHFAPQIVEAGSAIAGHGVAMLTPAFFRSELENGLLVQPFEQVGDDGGGYWLVYPESRRNSVKIKRFRSWLEKEAASFRGFAG